MLGNAPRKSANEITTSKWITSKPFSYFMGYISLLFNRPILPTTWYMTLTSARQPLNSLYRWLLICRFEKCRFFNHQIYLFYSNLYTRVWFNMKMPSYQCKDFPYKDKKIALGILYPENGLYIESATSFQCLTQWGRVTHTCARKLTIIDSDNGLLPGRHQAIIWTDAAIL